MHMVSIMTQSLNPKAHLINRVSVLINANCRIPIASSSAHLTDPTLAPLCCFIAKGLSCAALAGSRLKSELK